jgi:hypothetical protein
MAYFSGANSGCFRGAEQILVAAIKGDTFVQKSDNAPSDILINT